MKKLILLVLINLVYIPFSFGFLVPSANCVVPTTNESDDQKLETESSGCNGEQKADRLVVASNDNRDVNPQKYVDVGEDTKQNTEPQDGDATDPSESAQ